MNDLQAIYQMILDEPDADDVRLVFADALQETGEEQKVLHAEFIRLQIKSPEEGIEGIMAKKKDQKRLVEIWNQLDHGGQRDMIPLHHFEAGFPALLVTPLKNIVNHKVNLREIPWRRVRITDKSPLAGWTGQKRTYEWHRFPAERVGLIEEGPEHLIDSFFDFFALRMGRKNERYFIPFQWATEAVERLNHTALEFIRKARKV